MWHIKKSLNREDMFAAAKYFQGKHDFASFCNIECMKNGDDTVRDLTRLDLTIENDVMTFEFQAPSFLYNMIRIVVGTIVEIGLGKIKLCELPEIFEAKERKRAGAGAPAKGLCLVEIVFNE
eukprot:TRINITY_DN7039_c1_g2_i2.p1 TRINITY_DN7039_c1_g2~~TRINITY_DN7039_c1_g2_i2.p1  ORF type:complete len:122 (-),score=15.82 TRINITY_DN7039_c1_g2_i2:143-508(-)